MACPLLLFWPLVCEVRGSRGGRACGDEGEDAVMEMRLREHPQQFTSALLQLATRYLFILGAQVRLQTVKRFCSVSIPNIFVTMSSRTLFNYNLAALLSNATYNRCIQP